MASWVTAPVEFRVLSQTVITRGDVRSEVSVPVAVPTSVEGDPVITAIAAAVGDDVVEGQRLVEVSGRPVFVMQGSVPVYRTLRPGMTGADVGQLQAALTRLGCAIADEPTVFGESTKSCVAGFYADAGYDPVPSSPNEAADLAAARQGLTDAEAAVAVAQTAFDQAASGPTQSALLAAQQGLAAAQRQYNDIVASSAGAITQAQVALTVAQTELEQARTNPEATAADVAVAQAAVDSAVVAIDDAHRSGDTAIAAAADQVALAQVTLNETTAAPDRAAERVALDQAIAARDQAAAALFILAISTGATVPQGELVFSPTMPARVQTAVTMLGPLSAGTAGEGEPSGGGGSLMELAAGALVVDMSLRTDERELVQAGMAVELLDETSNTTYPATITAIAETASASADGGLGYPVVVTPDQGLPTTLAGTNLRVTITAASTDSPTLVVPLAAVSSSANGTTSVSVLARNDAGVDAEPITVSVAAGLSADGFVSIEPVQTDSLIEGDRVVVGR
jgi:peptidoglycan hydrolase-like protein with peptidoglycan-binding domain